MVIELPTPQEIIEIHGLDSPVLMNRGDGSSAEKYVTLGAALSMEKMFCPADAEIRDDHYTRSKYLLGILASGNSLDPQFYPHIEALFGSNR